MKFPIKDFFSKCDQILKKLWIWSHLLKKSLIGNFIFCVVLVTNTMLIFERCPTKHIYYDAYNYMLYSLRDKCNFSCN